MTDKAYIVANEQQEREVLEKLEQAGHTLTSGRKPTDWVPSKNILGLVQFPYALLDMGYVAWRALSQLTDEKIVFDGRKEEQMSDKYVVSQEFINELKEWKLHTVVSVFINDEDISKLPIINYDWWHYQDISEEECNNRLIAIIRWVNGEDVFEVEKPKKWVVHELNTKLYVTTYDGHTGITPNWDYITPFDTKEEAQEWANSHQEVIEVEE